MTLTHASNTGFITEIQTTKENSDLIFSGIFACEGEESCYDGNYITTFDIDDNNIADNGDRDLDYHKSMEFLKANYSSLSDKELAILYSLTAEDINARDIIDEDCTNIPFLSNKYKKVYDSIDEALFDIDGSELSDISWKCQNIRGLIAIEQGFDAICMNDEYGTSYLILAGSNFEVINTEEI